MNTYRLSVTFLKYAYPREDIVRWMERHSKTFYAYAMASRMIGEKRTFLIRQWIADMEEERL